MAQPRPSNSRRPDLDLALSEYSVFFRRNVPTYFVLAFGLAVIIAGGLIVGWLLAKSQTLENPWLAWAIGGIVVLFLLPFLFGAYHAIFVLWNNEHYGSRIDLPNLRFEWWRGPWPAKPHIVPIAQISEIHLIVGEGVDMDVRDDGGRKVELDANCVADSEKWARAMSKEFPHITTIVNGRIAKRDE